MKPRLLIIAFLTYVVLGGSLRAEPTVLITGGNRGIGLEFTRQYAARDYKVIATARNPDSAAALQALRVEFPNIVIEQLDVTDFAAIDSLAARYAEQPIDILINNAGVSGDAFRTQMFGSLDYSVFEQVMRVNALAPLKMAEAFMAHVAASEQKKIISVSSKMGSIALTNGIGYFYRSSKAALNMAMRSLAMDPTVGLREKEIIVGLVNPGATDTDLMRDRRGSIPLRSPEEAVVDMIRNIEAFNPDTTGTFVEYNGSPLPW
jgi:NAD(P)-dependent dehydrogenase (short-subunit alcohol dehydrogenase family)